MYWLGVGGVTVCVIAKVSERIREILYSDFGILSCEYATVSVYECVSLYARACVFARVRNKSGENNYVHGYICMCMFVFVSANKCIFKYDLRLFRSWLLF